MLKTLRTALGIGLLLGFGLVLSALFRSAGIAARVAAGSAQVAASPASPRSAETPESPGGVDPTAGWQLFKADAYGLAMEYPAAFFVEPAPSVKPSGALSSFLFAPQSGRGFLGPQTPAAILVVYEHTGASLPAWFESHATSKPFDDPAVSGADSPYYFREHTPPQAVVVAGQAGLRFSARTMLGEVRHTLLPTPDRAYVLDWQESAATASGDLGGTFESVLDTLTWTR